MSAFQNRRKGFRVSDHLNRKSTAFIQRKIDRMGRNDGFKTMDETTTKVFNICFGILRSRGVRCD